VEDLGLETYDTREYRFRFANGSEGATSTAVNLGPIEASVMNIDQPLLSGNDLTNSGHSIFLDDDGGHVSNNSTGRRSMLERVGGGWMMSVGEVLGLSSDSLDSNGSDEALTILSAQTARGTSHERVIHLHERSGHVPPEAMSAAITSGTWTGTYCTPDEISRVFSRYTCLSCELSKRSRLPTHRQRSMRVTLVGEVISADPVGKITPPTAQGCTWFILFKDICTGYEHAVVTRSKDAEAFVAALAQIVDFMALHGHTVRTLRTDSEEIFRSSYVLKSYLQANKISNEYSAPYTHNQNSVERDVQTVVKGTAALLHGQPWIRAAYWDLALLHFIRLRNRSLNIHHKTESAYQRVTGKLTDFSKTFEFSFGDVVSTSLSASERLWKFDVRRELGIVVGQPDGSVDSYLIYNPYDHSVVIRSNVVRLEVTGTQLAQWLGTREKMALARTPFHYIEGAILDFQRAAESDPTEEEICLRGPLFDSDETSEERVRSDTGVVHRIARRRIDYRNGVPGIDFDNHRNTRSTQSDTQDSSSDPQAVQCLLQIDSPIVLQYCRDGTRTEDSPTVRRALDEARTDRMMWKDAIRVEIQQLFDRGTLEPVKERDPSRRSRVIRSTMQLKLKRKHDGSVDKYKARCCASGDQLADEDFTTFSPTVSSPAMFVMLQLAIIDQMRLLTIDVVGAYLYQEYPEGNLPLYMTLQEEVAEACDLDPDRLYRIRKYLYGLPDAGRAFYEAYAEHLTDNGYQRAMSDPCLFIRHSSDGARTYLCIHVDDTFVASTSEIELALLQDILRQRFEITSCENIDSYLGIHIQQLDDGSVRLTQPKLITGLVLQYGHLFSGRTPTTPMRKRSSTATSDHDKFDYLHLLGGMMYLLKSRPDIGAALSFAATKSSAPTEDDFLSLLHCLHYLEGSRDLGLLLSTGIPGQELILTCFVDASYLTHADSRSHHGWTLSLGTYGSFYSKSKKQSIVATSSTHAEMRGVFELAEDIVFVLELLRELGRPVKLPAIIFEDNQPVIDLLAESHGRTNKSRHFLMIIEYIRQLVTEGLITVRKVSTECNTADILTKAVTGRDFAYKRQQLLGIEPGEIAEIPVANPRTRLQDA